MGGVEDTATIIRRITRRMDTDIVHRHIMVVRREPILDRRMPIIDPQM
jgi:hypothetical protein